MATTAVDLRHPRQLQARLADVNDALALQREAPESVRELVRELAGALADPEAAQRFAGADPYLVNELGRSALGAMLALDEADPAMERRQVRVRLEQMRHVLRDMAEQEPVSEERTAKQVAQWLVGATSVSQRELAGLVGVGERTLQRWVSPSDRSAPEGDNERRLRAIARVFTQLRHSLTGVGAIQWSERPRPELANRTPADLLNEPDAAARLTELAAGMRSSSAG